MSDFKSKRKKRTLAGTILKKKAKQIFREEYHDKDENAFRICDEWFSKFKKRHGIRFLKICGEIRSSNVALVIPFINRYRAKVAEMGLMKSQIYNVDETGLFFR